MRKDKLSWSQGIDSSSSISDEQGERLSSSVRVASADGQSVLNSRRVPAGQRRATSGHRTKLCAGCGIKGEMFFSGISEIDCTVEGEIAAEGELIIGERGQVLGGIRAERLVVFGTVAGDIVCSERIQLNSGARVTGSICSPRIEMHDGVHFEGECSMPADETNAHDDEDFSSTDDPRLANE